jgi:hypothetical protein
MILQERHSHETEHLLVTQNQEKFDTLQASMAASLDEKNCKRQEIINKLAAMGAEGDMQPAFASLDENFAAR